MPVHSQSSTNEMYPDTLSESTPEHPPSILTLPDELLEQIFYCAVMAVDFSLQGPAVLPLWHIIRVSKHWHSVAMSSPRLWCKKWYLSLDRCGFSKEVREKMFLRVKFFLERSRNHPISFMFQQHQIWRDDSDENSQTALSISSLLAKHSSQWREVQLYLRCAVALQTLPVIRGNVPLLRQLILVISVPPEGTCNLQCFEEAPLLRGVRLHVGGGRRSPEPIQISMPWHQLDKYTTRADRYAIGVRNVLATSKRLLTLSFTEPVPVSGSRSFGSLAQLQNETLTTLDMNLSASQSAILPHLHVPKLIDLRINSSLLAHDSSNFFTDVHTLILQSKCNLLSLSLTGRNCSEGELSSILALCEDLETLSLTAPLHASDVQRLGSDASPLIPRVVKISLYILSWARSVEELELDPVLPALDAVATSRERMHREGSILVRSHLGFGFQFANGDLHDYHLCVLARLEGFPPVSSPATFSMIRRWEQVLGDLERLQHVRLPPLHSYKFHKILKEMEGYRIERSDLTLLNRTDVPQKLSKSKFVWGTEAKFLKLEQRSQKVIESWKPILTADARISRRWVIQRSARWFHYLYSDDERRVGDDAWKIVIGRD